MHRSCLAPCPLLAATKTMMNRLAVRVCVCSLFFFVHTQHQRYDIRCHVATFLLADLACLGLVSKKNVLEILTHIYILFLSCLLCLLLRLNFSSIWLTILNFLSGQEEEKKNQHGQSRNKSTEFCQAAPPPACTENTYQSQL